MTPQFPSMVDEIEARICQLQLENVSLQERLKNTEHKTQQTLEGYILRIIDMLDMLDAIQSASDLSDEENTRMVIKKINKRLMNFLSHCEVKEIVFEQGQFLVGEVNVLDRVASSTVPSGRIVQICRKGYRQGDKIIRAAEVVTAC